MGNRTGWVKRRDIRSRTGQVRGGVAVVGQKTLAVVKMRRRCMVVEWMPRYWAIGLAVGRHNYHMHVGPIGLSLTKGR